MSLSPTRFIFLLLALSLLLSTVINTVSAKSDNDDKSTTRDEKGHDNKDDDSTVTKQPSTMNDIDYRPDMNAIPELYPEKYPGLTALQQPHTTPIPLSFNWCSLHQCSPNLQQHITYTPLCFLHASLHMLNDRINYEIEKEQLGVPSIMLSRQDYLDYAHLTGYGNDPLHNGGEGSDVLEYMRQFGLPDETCNPWQSDGQNHEKNDMSDRCRNCMMLYNDNKQHCWNVKKFVKYYVDSYNFVRGEKQMMNEVFHNGPIQCGVVVDDEMIYSYAGGIYNDFGRLSRAVVDHDVTIYGWGEHIDKDTGDVTPYWVVRNSWGSSLWGTHGFMLVHRGNNTMRIEERCLFARVDIRELRDHLAGENVGTMFGLINPKTEKPRLYPVDWEKLDHDYAPEGTAEEDQKEQDKLDKWMSSYIYTKQAEERRQQADEDIIIGAPKSTQTTIFEWIFGVTGMICIGVLLAVIGALWLYFANTSNDGYQPIPHAEL